MKKAVEERVEPATSSFQWIERIRQGDREAFAPLFEKYRSRLGVLIYYGLSVQLRGLIEVDDILQETFLRAFKEFDQFTYQTPGSFFRWLARISNNVIVDTARHHGRQKRQAAELLRFRSESNPEGPEPVDSMTPSRLLAHHEGLRRLLSDLDALPDDYRRVILLSRIEGLSTAEVAETLGKTREATALLLHRAIKKLRQTREARGSG
ncbi:MAG: hypothetical protein DMG08_27680 [Acidobacteria bacterium]|nr:MAG: hypothetical protein DMG08_27680 [Acidobacteriota bacterium]PYV29936.1 MAG: hypothetical protein DMG09_28610 [Acidobacteriota bacterium]